MRVLPLRADQGVGRHAYFQEGNMKISIRWALILGCLGLIWGTQVLISTSTYLSWQRVLLGHAGDIMQNITDLTMEQSQNHLALAQGAAHLTERLITSKVVGSDLSQTGMLEHYFLDQLAIYDHFAGIYVGFPNGDFLYVSRSDRYAPDGFRTKTIRHVDGQRQTRLVWRDAAFARVGEEPDPQDQYDPRKRPWYIKAFQTKAIVWTDPYIFFTSRKPGITVAGPLLESSDRLKAIVGVDIEISQLSTFMGQLRIGKNGRAFMLNNNADVVAFPDLDKLSFSDAREDGKLRLVRIDELNDGLSRAAFHAIHWQYDHQGRLELENARFARFKYQGQAYDAMFTPFKDRQWPWIIGVYVPESDYLGSIQANRRFNLYLTLGLSVLATVVGLLLARAIIRPLAGLEAEALAIRHNSSAPDGDIRSAFKEIQETADSFVQMKADLRAGEEKYRGIFENIQDVYYEVTLDGCILEISPSIRNVSNFSREDLIGAPLESLYQDIQDRQSMLDRLIADGKIADYEITMVGKDGQTEICSVYASLMPGQDGQPEKIIGSLRVVTDRKRAEVELQRHQERLEELVRERTTDLLQTNQQLRDQISVREEKEKELLRSEEKYRSIIENMEDGYYEVNMDGTITFFNKPLAEILGYSGDQLQGLHYTRYMDRETAKTVRRRFVAILRTGKSEKLVRYTVTRPDGTQRTLDASAALIMDNNGSTIGFRGVVLDITERLNAELEKKRLEDRFQLVQRLEGIGTLAGGVAHDFNNLLMGIQGNVSLMLMDMAIDDIHYEKLRSIEACVVGGADLTRRLLGFARGGKYMVRPMDFNEVVTNTARMFQRTRKEIRIHEKIEPRVWTVMADQSQIEQVLLNLYINAWQAMSDDGHIYLETKNVELDAAFAHGFEIAPGRYVRISITDTGTGIEPEIQSKIFEPFFTTKEIGRGTGLGLASAYGIIKNHDGAIDFSSEVGRGTTFYIYLPASDAVVPKPSPAATDLTAGSETILLVDDEKVIVDVNRPMLEKLGYTVLTAEGGREAIEVFDANYDRIDMVILDMIMPDLGGGAVFDHLKKVSPDIKVLLSSGYSISGQAEEILSRGCAGFIQKPFNMKMLSKKIRKILDGNVLDSGADGPGIPG
jgi:two-component system, cell cycle sensor histidine kinase and response regulator CckA